MTALQDAISFYLDNGYTLTPLNGKIPLIKKWQKTEYDPFFETNNNFGVVLQDDDLVIDIDPRNGGKVPDWLTIETFTVKTGGGGWHYYFKKPVQVGIVNLLKEYPGVEFKTKGQQVVGFGCRTTGEYIIENNTRIKIVPPHILKLIERKQDILKKVTDKKIDFVSDQQTQERFIEYLTHCPVAIEGQNGDLTTFSVACHARDLGLEEAIAVNLMVIHYNPRCVPPWPIEEINIKVNNAYKYAANDAGTLSPKNDFDIVEKQDGVSGWEHDKGGKLKKTFRNTLNVLLMPNTEISGLFQFNEFSENIEFTKESPWHKSEKDSRQWTDADAVLLKEWLVNNYSIEPDVSIIHECVLAISKKKSYHPIKSYLQSLKWDGKERIGTWLIDYLGVEDDVYIREAGQKFLCAAVARIFQPGVKFDYLMVLEGVQGQGKSRICQALGGNWHIGLRLDPHNKDFIDYMHSKWIIEIEEMDVATKAESQAIKAFLSRDTDRCRLAYARLTKDFPRQCVFIGTYNPVDGESTYLKDPTGNRRFWPIGIEREHIDVQKLADDRDQLWAEAVVKAKNEKLFLTRPAEEICIFSQQMRAELDPWHDLVEDWAKCNVAEGKAVSGLMVYTQCIGGKSENYNSREGRRIGNIFRALKWHKCSVWNRESGGGERGYRKPITCKVLKPIICEVLKTDKSVEEEW